MKEDGPNYSTNFRKKATFTLTEEGKKQLVLDKRQPFPGKDYGRFCYGKVKLTKVLRRDEPTKLGNETVTTVTYSYAMIDVPKWAENKQLETSFPVLGTDVTGKGQANLGGSLVDGRWQPAADVPRCCGTDVRRFKTALGPDAAFATINTTMPR